MGIFYTPIELAFNLLMMLTASLFLLAEIKKIPWKKWREPTAFSAWCASIIVLTLLWHMRVHVQTDLSLHLIGLAMFALMFGRALTCVGAALSVLAYTAEFDGLWLNLGTNILLLAVIPALLSDFILKKNAAISTAAYVCVFIWKRFFWGIYRQCRYRTAGTLYP